MLDREAIPAWENDSPPRTLGELREFCDARARIRPDTFLVRSRSGLGVFRIPLYWVDETADMRPLPIKGKYGICFSCTNGELEVVTARCGFYIDTESDYIEISHTPQGISREVMNTFPRTSSDEVKRAALNSLLQMKNKETGVDFRRILINDVLTIAHILNIKMVVGSAAEHHKKVTSGSISLYDGEKRMDALYKDFGFKLNDSGKKYILYLATTGV